MPAKRKVPSYSRHKASGQAVVRIHGRDHYLGPYGSPESHRYARLIAQWRDAPAAATGPVVRTADLSINELLLAYVEFAGGYYTKVGKPNKEFDLLRYAMRPLKALFGHSRAAEFGPKDLEMVQQHLIDQDLARNYINGQINRIKRIFKWAVGEELVAPSVLHGLQAVSGLRRGRSKARETQPVRPVPETDVEAILPYVAPSVAAMIRLQRLTGMRSGELVVMRGCDIDMRSEVWLYTPADHKNQWREQSKVIPLGPQAQAIILPLLKLETTAYLFSPQDAAQWHRAQRAVQSDTNRRTKFFPSERRRLARQQQERRFRVKRRVARERYDTGSYRQAVQYGIERARRAGLTVADWHPHQLRHTKATEIRHRFALEAAQVALGHASAEITQVYAERNLRLAIEIANQTG